MSGKTEQLCAELAHFSTVMAALAAATDNPEVSAVCWHCHNTLENVVDRLGELESGETGVRGGTHGRNG